MNYIKRWRPSAKNLRLGNAAGEYYSQMAVKLYAQELQKSKVGHSLMPSAYWMLSSSQSAIGEEK